MQNIRAAPALCLHDRLLIATEHNVLQVAKYTVYILSLSRREQKIRGWGGGYKTTKDATKKSNISLHNKGCVVAADGTESRWSLKDEAKGGKRLCVRGRERASVKQTNVCASSCMFNQACVCTCVCVRRRAYMPLPAADICVSVHFYVCVCILYVSVCGHLLLPSLPLTPPWHSQVRPSVSLYISTAASGRR